MKILITGASGLVGRSLLVELQKKGHVLHALVRNKNSISELPPAQVFAWDANKGDLPEAAIAGFDAVIHLAGDPVADGRWTEKKKIRIQQSRWEGTKRVVEAMAALPEAKRPKIFLSASAIGIYGDTGDAKVDEASPAGNDFLAKTVVRWEEESLRAESLGVRVCLMRFGVILARGQGALAKMGPEILGDGKQWFSWIHGDDLVRFIEIALIDDRMRGAYNLTAPNPVTNKEFTKELVKALGYPLALPVPKFVLKLVLGEMATAILSSQRVLPERALTEGFTFNYPTVTKALQNLFPDHSYLHTEFKAAQFVPENLAKVFDFFSKAQNLERITPPWLNFRVTGVSTPNITEGTIIDYKLKIHGAPVRWRSKITNWNPDHEFVDLQLKGPYSLWHHTHGFHEVPGGTLVTDRVLYRTPGHILGKLLLGRWIAGDVRTIFAYRKKVIGEIFRN